MTQQPITEPLFKEPRFTQEDQRHDITVIPLRRGLKQRLTHRNRPARIAPKTARQEAVSNPEALAEALVALQTAQAYMDALQWNEAMTHLNQAVHLNPHCVSAWVSMGKAYEALDIRELAFESFQEAIRLEPFNIVVLKALIGLSESLRWWDKAVQYYQRYTSLFPAEEVALFGYAVALEHQERYKEAITIYDRIVAKDAQYLPALNNRSGCYMNLNEYEQAVAGFKHVLKIMPNFSRAILGLAIAQDMAGQPAHAILGYRRYLHLQPYGGHAQTVHERLEELKSVR